MGSEAGEAAAAVGQEDLCVALEEGDLVREPLVEIEGERLREVGDVVAVEDESNGTFCDIQGVGLGHEGGDGSDFVGGGGDDVARGGVMHGERVRRDVPQGVRGSGAPRGEVEFGGEQAVALDLDGGRQAVMGREDGMHALVADA